MVDRQLHYDISQNSFIEDVKTAFSNEATILLRDACELLDSFARHGLELSTEIQRAVQVEACGRELLRIQPELLEAEGIYKLLEALNTVMYRTNEVTSIGCVPSQQLMSLLLMVASLNSHPQRAILIDEAVDSDQNWRLVKDFHFRCISEQATAIDIYHRSLQKRFFNRWKIARETTNMNTNTNTNTVTISLLSSSVTSKQPATQTSSLRENGVKKQPVVEGSQPALPKSQLSPFGLSHRMLQQKEEAIRSDSTVTPSVRILDDLPAAALGNTATEDSIQSRNRSQLSRLSHILDNLPPPPTTDRLREEQTSSFSRDRITDGIHFNPFEGIGQTTSQTSDQIIATSCRLMSDSNSRLDMLLEGVKDAAVKAAAKPQRTPQKPTEVERVYTPEGKEIELSESDMIQRALLKESTPQPQIMTLNLLGDIKKLLRQSSDGPTDSQTTSKRVAFADTDNDRSHKLYESTINQSSSASRLQSFGGMDVLSKPTGDENQFVSSSSFHSTATFNQMVSQPTSKIKTPTWNASPGHTDTVWNTLSNMNPRDAHLRMLRAMTEFQVEQPRRKLSAYFKGWRKKLTNRKKAISQLTNKINRRLESKYFVRWTAAAEDEQQLREHYERTLKNRFLDIWKRRLIENQTADSLYEHNLRLTHIHTWRMALLQRLALRQFVQKSNLSYQRSFFMKWKLSLFLKDRNTRDQKEIFDIWRTKSNTQQIQKKYFIKPTWEDWKVRCFQQRKKDQLRKILFDNWRADTYRNRMIVGAAWSQWRDELATRNYINELTEAAVTVSSSSLLRKMLLLWKEKYRSAMSIRLQVEGFQREKKSNLRQQLFYRWQYLAWESAASTEVRQMHNRKLLKRTFAILKQELLTPPYLRSAEVGFQQLHKLRVFNHWRRCLFLNRICTDNEAYLQQSTLRAGLQSWKVMFNRKLMMRVADSKLWQREDRMMERMFKTWRKRANRVSQLCVSVSDAQYEYNLQMRCFIKWATRFDYRSRIRESEEHFYTLQYNRLVGGCWKLWKSKFLKSQLVSRRASSSRVSDSRQSVPRFWGAAT
eukprot:TRINITY_DN2618_c5_g1_i1.p1 TRINITY_DN2618_c5_g1~~TRINITY_DN2618_c5_g1_i1.p1  ORF type:complete len:1047 (+),score=216.56 TRINITY_DN2618_c5_g1_i1:126-3266(+)